MRSKQMNADKELKKLNKTDLLIIMKRQEEENEKMQKQIELLTEQVTSHENKLSGNQVSHQAHCSVKPYHAPSGNGERLSVKTQKHIYSPKKDDGLQRNEAKARAEKIIEEAYARRERIIKQAKQEAEALWEQQRMKLDEYCKAHRELQRMFGIDEEKKF